jgi:hypothetical protein
MTALPVPSDLTVRMDGEVPELRAMPIVVEVGKYGFFSVTPHIDKNVLWVTNITAKKRGDGNKVLQAMIKYAKDRGMILAGELNPYEPGMSRERLQRWYEIQGAEIVDNDYVKF